MNAAAPRSFSVALDAGRLTAAVTVAVRRHALLRCANIPSGESRQLESIEYG
jgi:hypothetical protein